MIPVHRLNSFTLRGIILAAIAACVAAPAFAGGTLEDAPGERRTAAIAGSPSLPNPADLEAQLPFNPQIAHGRLANGMRYFALSHPHPENSVQLRLIVDAGSVLESESQRGLAHFVEHMAFNGTEEFGEDELVAYLEGLGIEFGPDVNAYTSFDETVYRLEVPTDDEDAFATGFRVMEQWAHALTFEPDAIERERGVVVEEWRGSRGANMRLLETHIPVLLAGSRYAERLPIGQLEVIRNAPRSEFVQFYERWYRPDNMAFIAVGDMPAEDLAARVREHLGGIAAPAEPLDRPYHFVPRRAGTRVSIASDPEATRSTVSTYVLNDPFPGETIGDYRSSLVRSLYVSIINERLREISRNPDAAITGGGIGYNRFLRDTEIAVGSVVARDHRVLEALELLARELERGRRFGVLESEVERARRRLLQSIESTRVNFDSSPSSRLAQELVRHWTEGESVPGIDYEYRLFQELLPTIAAGEVSAVAEQFMRENNRVLLASLRIGEDGLLPNGSEPPTEAQFRDVVARVAEAELESPADQTEERSVLDVAPTPGEIVDRREHPEVETTEYRLSNGMRVFVRPSDLSEDEILVSAYSPGGLARLPDELVPAARIATRVAGQSGLGTLDAGALERLLSGRSAGISASLNRVSEGLSGNARAADLELLFEMLRAAFTAPRFSDRALDNVRQQTIQSIRGSMASPQGRFSRRFQEVFSGGDPRLAPLTEEELQGITLDQVRRVYDSRFSNPEDFALFVVGSVEADEIATLAARYLGGIERATDPDAEPSTDAGFFETIPDSRYPRPEGLVQERVRAGQEPAAQFVMVMHGPYEWSRRANHRLNSVGSLLDIRLREVIREALGGAYSVGAGAFRWRRPEPWAYTQLAFGLDPDRLEELRERALGVVEELRNEVPAQNYLQRIKAQQRQQYQQQLQENGYWLSTLQFYVQHGRDLATIRTFPDLIDSLSAEELQQTAARYLNSDRAIELVLLPAATQE